MRLINTATLDLKEFEGEDVPLYSILSHTWGEDEVTYQDVQAGRAEGKLGYQKIKNACKRAAADGFEYIWIDTCCIDKKSSAELSEAINSMCRWYHEAIVCYAYLADVSSSIADTPTTSGIHCNTPPRSGIPFRKSRWFTRGWTLQELLMPQVVVFLSSDWQEIGTKSSLREVISKITRIPLHFLQGGVDSANIAEKMSWASKRKTKRVEDEAYCLMGLFGVHMPLLYGEGKNAFIRLQEEIMRVSDDHSIFAWKGISHGDPLAKSPAAFKSSGGIKNMHQPTPLTTGITVSSQGIHSKLPVSKWATHGRFHHTLLPCKMGGEPIAIYLEPIPETKHTYRGATRSFSTTFAPDFPNPQDHLVRDICIRRGRRPWRLKKFPLHDAAELGNKELVNFLIGKVAVDSENQFGLTPLFLASENGHLPVARLLLEKGADPNPTNILGETPISVAAKYGHESLVKLLLEKALASPGSDSSKTMLDYAERRRHAILVEALFEARQHRLQSYGH
ncbi:uncharacterized protein Z520_01994 [Fonsecaea multimorphosa CBS 102226]|uniref:Uncharacterized protein n=1 Tax=Fonsecaea multimorphosa CBS 102226 TaxID=1442371 RepID=A0A0D2HIY2_9EURO|nr:uncharacterized protein Z520_01994 [Fonsecaea multimorphosa CBS 102226]KIY01856.1 hypothetical protein Z520_01994 [Fonsecaea multimorphosa CBS 102226]OAL29540.1 hypothetical protein AYO22_01954 [Fonsecaea multimorphosa]